MPIANLDKRTRCAPWILALLLFAPAGPALPSDAEPPRLVVMLAIDQLRRDRLDESLPGGLGRIVREGRSYPRAVLDHALTDTCPGHATMLSGRHPGAVGVPSNNFIDAASGERSYCVDDSAEDAQVHGLEDSGRSPRNLRVTMLGDWLKQAQPKARVFSVAGKDRAAIALGGQRPDAAFWFESSDRPGFTTSRYYLDALPNWVWIFNGTEPGTTSGFWAALPDTWTHAASPDVPAARNDDFPGEATERRRTSPHPLRDSDPETFAENLLRTPFGDLVTLEFARTLVDQYHLGQGETTDLLALSLSATDLVGHLYGPFSHESHDALRRLDEGLGAFLGFLEERVGKGRVLLALSSDHGVLPLPEWLEKTGQATCPVKGGRVGVKMLGLGLYWDLHRRFTWILAWPRDWIRIAGSQIAVNREVASRRGVPVREIRDRVERYLEEQPAIAQVWTPEELAGAPADDEIARLYRNSFDPERSGDLLIQIAPGCLISSNDTGTTHGTPWAYDREVPIVFWGAGIAPAKVDDEARTIDIAPTLARKLGIPAPAELDGRPLF